MWPVSREFFPKQLVKFIGKDSLVQNTVKRLSPLLDLERVRIVCGKEHANETARHLEEINLSPKGKIFYEPCGRNTAPAILLAVLTILKSEPDAVICVFPADHVIRDIGSFHHQIETAAKLAGEGLIVTFGIEPHYPEPGYGYIEGGANISHGALEIRRFVEKPDLETAQQYIQAGNFFWNSGMFAFNASVMVEEFALHQPSIIEPMQQLLSKSAVLDHADYERLPNISIDYAIMEKTTRGAVLPSGFGWSDIGSWKSLYEYLPKDDCGNVIDGDVIAWDTHNSFVMGHNRLITVNHLENVVVVDTPDSVFVSDVEHSRHVKQIVSCLKDAGRREYKEHRTVYHSWGKLAVIEKQIDYRIKRRTLYENSYVRVDFSGGAKVSFVVVKGEGTIQDKAESRRLAPGDAMTIALPAGKVAINNMGAGNFVLLETEIHKND